MFASIIFLFFSHLFVSCFAFCGGTVIDLIANDIIEQVHEIYLDIFSKSTQFYLTLRILNNLAFISAQVFNKNNNI